MKMAVARGYNRVVGVGQESAFGTVATIWKYADLMTEGLKWIKPQDNDTGIMGLPMRTRSLQGNISVEGSIGENVLFPEGSLPLILKAHCGAVTSVVQGGTAAVKHTFAYSTSNPFGDTTGLSIKVKRDIGTIYDCLGCVIPKLTFKSAINGKLMWAADVIGKTFASGDSPSATYPSPSPFMHYNAAITFAGASIDINEWEISSEQPYDDQIYGTSQTRTKLITSGFRNIGGSFTKPYIEDSDVADLFNKYWNNTTVALTITFTGVQIEGAYNYEMKWTIPIAKFSDLSDFAAGGIENPKAKIPFIALGQSDGTTEISELYIQNTESSI
jgi:hypothetical protein